MVEAVTTSETSVSARHSHLYLFSYFLFREQSSDQIMESKNVSNAYVEITIWITQR
jgi:hypothetical protein